MPMLVTVVRRVRLLMMMAYGIAMHVIMIFVLIVRSEWSDMV